MPIFGRSKGQKEKANVQKHPAQPYVQQQPHTADAYINITQATNQALPQILLNDSPPAQGNLSLKPDSALAPYHAYSQVTVSQTYLIPSQQLTTKKSRLQKTGVGSVADLLRADTPSCVPGAQIFNEALPSWYAAATQHFAQGAPLCDIISIKFNEVLTLIDDERFSGKEEDLMISHPSSEIPSLPSRPKIATGHNGHPKGSTCDKVSNVLTETRTNYFAKVNQYANSKLPPNLPSAKLYRDVRVCRLLCLAAQYSQSVYSRPTGAERETHVNADWRHGTKAMVIKSVPVDNKDVIVFAIRGSQTFMDWKTNFNHTPVPPEKFLDDEGNLCHSGYLRVARKMIQPVAARLRKLLHEDPSRKHCALILTGHSAGGAVAALLYSHMLSTSKATDSELNALTTRFRRIHCVTFGAPPISLLPLRTPPSPHLQKSLFLSIINEGDPVPRADKAYVRSLLDLYSTPAPGQTCLESATPSKLRPWITGSNNYSETALAVPPKKSRPSRPKASSTNTVPTLAPVWKVPQATLSNAGKLVVLREVGRLSGRPGKKHRQKADSGVIAQVVTDEQLRGVIWGDPVCHMMDLYRRRVNSLAEDAVTGRSSG